MADALDQSCRSLLSFANRLEVNRNRFQIPNSRITLSDLESLYELLYLKAFLLWESFQEEVFVRLLMGYQSNGGQETLNGRVAFHRNLADARAAMLRGRDFQLWHNPDKVIARSDHFFDPATSFFKQVISANLADLRSYAAVRHRIAHAQDHAEAEFNNATMDLAGKRYAGAHAGRFLRDGTGLVAPQRWLEAISLDLVATARQLC